MSLVARAYIRNVRDQSKTTCVIASSPRFIASNSRLGPRVGNNTSTSYLFWLRVNSDNKSPTAHAYGIRVAFILQCYIKCIYKAYLSVPLNSSLVTTMFGQPFTEFYQFLTVDHFWSERFVISRKFGSTASLKENYI